MDVNVQRGEQVQKAFEASYGAGSAKFIKCDVASPDELKGEKTITGGRGGRGGSGVFPVIVLMVDVRWESFWNPYFHFTHPAEKRKKKERKKDKTGLQNSDHSVLNHARLFFLFKPISKKSTSE